MRVCTCIRSSDIAWFTSYCCPRLIVTRTCGSDTKDLSNPIRCAWQLLDSIGRGASDEHAFESDLRVTYEDDLLYTRGCTTGRTGYKSSHRPLCRKCRIVVCSCLRALALCGFSLISVSRSTAVQRLHAPQPTSCKKAHVNSFSLINHFNKESQIS